MKPFFVQADETDGERSRLIEFVVWASNLGNAVSLAYDVLKEEWPFENPTFEDGVLDFAGMVIIDNIQVWETSIPQIVRRMSRSQVENSDIENAILDIKPQDWLS